MMGDAAIGRIGQVERTGRILGLAGLFPFVLLAVWLASIAPGHIWYGGTILLLRAYAAIVLSFLGGISWGTAMARPAGDGGGALVLAVLPPIIAWLSFVAAVPYVFAVLAVAFAAQGASDAFAVHAGRAPAWFGRLRIMLTLVVVGTLIVAFAATV